MKKIAKIIFSVLLFAYIAFHLISFTRIGAGNDYINPLSQTVEAKQIQSFSQDIVSNIQRGDFVELAKYYGPNINDENINDIVIATKLKFPNKTPDNIQLIGLNKNTIISSGDKPSKINVQTMLQYEFTKDPSQASLVALNKEWYLVSVAYSQTGNKKELIGFDFTKISNALENIHKVVFSKASHLQLLVIALSLLITFVILTAVIICLKTSNLKHKWLWIIFILFGIVGITFNWTAESFTLNLFSFQLLGSGYYRMSRYAPLLIHFSIPWGAMIFLVKQWISKQK